jgi:hypothetical protein
MAEEGELDVGGANNSVRNKCRIGLVNIDFVQQNFEVAALDFYTISGNKITQTLCFVCQQQVTFI